MKTGSFGFANEPQYVEGKCHPMAALAHASHGKLGNTIEKWEVTKVTDPYAYLYGYGNEHFSEALPNTLPLLGNTPMRVGNGCYAEQLSGTSFTTPRVHNRKAWLYKMRPSAAHKPFQPYKNDLLAPDHAVVEPNQLRWKPFALPDEGTSVDFVDGMKTVAVSGDPAMKAGIAIHVYTCNADMKNRAFCNSDGDMLIVPQLTPLDITTEFGKMRVAPGEFCIIPRGVKFRVYLDFKTDYSRKEGDIKAARGYICEVYDGHFVIPDLGPIGANGLANPRHFAAPTAYYEDLTFDSATPDTTFTLLQKYCGKLFATTVESSPFDVVAWSGNYVPYKYDLANFNTINSVSFDHLDPSIFTVVTCQTAHPGVAALDFVVFPPRFAVQEDTFRPPYYHRNIMSEFMGNIMGQYDAKPDGFLPGGASLHSCMIGHGPDADTYKKFSNKDTAPVGPVRMSKNDLAFMFESTYVLKLTPYALEEDRLNTEYYKCWTGLQKDFPATSTHQ